MRALAAESAVVAARLASAAAAAAAGGAESPSGMQQALLLLNALNVAIRSGTNREVLAGAQHAHRCCPAENHSDRSNLWQWDKPRSQFHILSAPTTSQVLVCSMP